MRRVIIQIMCNGCEEDIPEKEAYPVEMKADGAVYEADLCKRCLVHWTQPMTMKRTRRKTQQPTGEFPCATCGKVFQTGRGLTTHIQRLAEKGEVHTR